MAASGKFTDETLRGLLSADLPQREIAQRLGVSEAAVSKRIKALEKKARALAPPHAERAVSSMWNVRDAAQANYLRALELLDQPCTPAERVRVIAEIRQHVEFGMSVLDTMYAAMEVQAFMEEVLYELEQVEAGSRERILGRLREKRSIRAAFFTS